MMHILSTHPEIQEKLRQEIYEVLGDKEEPSYDEIIGMEYLDMCINEVLRLYPPATRLERICTKDWEWNGIKIDKGTIVGVPTYALQHDPEYWENPEIFNPERYWRMKTFLY